MNCCQDLTVLIVNYNSHRLVENLVARVAPFPVVIVNNDATERVELARLAELEPDRIRVLQPGENLGYGSGMNLGLRATATERVALLNPDVDIDCDQLSRLARALCVNHAAVVAPRVVDADGRIARTAFMQHLSPLTFMVDVFCSRLKTDGMVALLLREIVGANRSFGPSGRVRALNGAVWVAEAAALRDAGLFNERFFLYGEESELCERLDRAGELLWFEASIQVRHLGGASSHGRRQTQRRLASTALAFQLQGRTAVAWLLRHLMHAIRGARPEGSIRP